MWCKCYLIIALWAVISAFELGGIVSGNRMASVPLGMTLGDGELDVEGICNRPGVACQNCTHAVTCIALPVGWLKVPLDTCPEDQSCNARLGGCSTQAVPECEKTSLNFEHICEQVGIFPDAYDCRKFHLCSPPEAQPSGNPADHRVALCPMHYAYNAANAQCSILLPHGQCQKRPVPECTKVGQTGVLEDGPNHYYVCLSKQGKLYPQVFICPHGFYFHNGFCQVNPPQGSKPVVTRSSPSESPKSTSTSTETATSVVTATAKSTEYPPDTFLADRFDLTNYETIDDTVAVPQVSYEFTSFESSF